MKHQSLMIAEQWANAITVLRDSLAGRPVVFVGTRVVASELIAVMRDADRIVEFTWNPEALAWEAETNYEF